MSRSSVVSWYRVKNSQHKTLVVLITFFLGVSNGIRNIPAPGNFFGNAAAPKATGLMQDSYEIREATQDDLGALLHLEQCWPVQLRSSALKLLSYLERSGN
jgi:hypothetical protein